MNRGLRCVKLIALAFFYCALSTAYAQDGLRGALVTTNFAQPLRLSPAGLLPQTLAAADFDNDQNLDGAVLVNSTSPSRGNRFRIEFHFSGSKDSELTFESTEKVLSIIAFDLNSDGAPDVLVEQALTHRRLYVWINDGRGRFRKARVEDFPSTDSATSQQASTPSSSAEY